MPTEVFPAGAAGPFSLGSLEWTGVIAALFVGGQRWLLMFRGGYFGGWR